MRNCFVCTTPYQILTVLSMIKGIDGTSDLYITNQFAGADKLTERIRQEGIFGEVVCVNEGKIYSKYNREGSPFQIRTGMVRMYKDIDEIVERFIKHEDEYTHVFVSSKCLTGRMVILYLYKHYGLKLCSYFDDGIGSYINKSLTEASWIDNLCRCVFIDRKANQLTNSDWYLYSAELFRLIQKDDHKPVYKIRFIDNNEQNLSLICRLFGLKNIDVIQEKVIVLDSLRHSELTEEGVLQIEDLFDVISDQIGEDQLIFKTHPRDKESHTGYNYLLSKGDISLPFELYGLAQDLSDKVLITNMSTAVFSPKLVLDQEPAIILLFKILENQLLNKTKIDEVVGYFKKIYSDSTKIYVPETEAELKEILEGIKD